MNNSVLSKKLKWYNDSTRSFQERLEKGSSHSKKALRNSGLATLIPLAAIGLYPSMSTAQCFTSTPGGGQYLNLDSSGGPEVFVGPASYFTASSVIAIGLASSIQPIFSCIPSATNCIYPAAVNFANPYTDIFFGASFAILNAPNLATTGGATAPINNFSVPGSGTMVWAITSMSAIVSTFSLQLSITSSGAVSFTGFNGGPISACAVLPVELTTFELKNIDNRYVGLEWSTNTEVNNAGFEVQRSIDGEHYYKIGWVDGRGNTTEAANYAFVDQTVRSNVNYYYRLKQLDYNGKEEYSDSHTIKLQSESFVKTLQIYPNPSSGNSELVVEIQSTTSESSKIELFNQLGQKVREMDVNLIGGFNQLSVDVADLKNGNYFAKIKVDGEQLYKKIILTD